MKIPVIDNGGQWTHREWRVLRDLDVDSTILPNTVPPEALAGVDGVVLSGGALSLEGSDVLGRVGEWIDALEAPVLGICVGHQYLARHFGGTVGHSASPEFGRVSVQIEETGHPLLEGLPSELSVWENHNDQVTQLPPGWRRIARSESCPVQVMVDPARPRFGVQFHPEVEHTEGGRKLFENFLRLCSR
ncbi:MAG TPA: GMP synthase subunit A [Thermoplasmata archaeon]|nr:GMP synthase subunit A [Thermoplasmata archaeon]